MGYLWSGAGATGGNRAQIEGPRKRLKQADRQPVATHGNGSGAHGKEGVDGSSPSEGSAKAPHVGAFAFRSTCSSSIVQWVWSRLWSFRVAMPPAARPRIDQLSVSGRAADRPLR